MLQSIRDKAQGWIAWAIVILISIPFALFGIQEYLGTSSDPVVAEVDGTEIKQSDLDKRMRDFRETMRLTLGGSFQQEMFESDTFKQQILQAMIDETLLQQAADDWNMRASDAQTRGYIQSIPAFQNNGGFDQRVYESAVRNRGMSSAGFESVVRQEMVMQQMQTGVRNSAFVTGTDLGDQVRLSGQKRSIAFARIDAAAFEKADQVSEEEARAYYQQHQNDYAVAERVKLAYIRLNSEVLSPLIEVDDEALQAYFDDHRDAFVVDEERRVRHILLATNTDNEAQQLAKAQDLLQQLRDGGDFAALAEANSDDPGSAANGGDLGWVNRGVMVEPFEDAAFALDENAFSEPVKSQFGYHLIQVTDIRGGSDAGFEDVRAEVEAAYRKQQAEELFYDRFERLADGAYENPDSLEPAAEVLGLTIQRTGWVDRASGLPGDLDVPKVLNTAFSEDVLQRGNNSEVIELGPTDAIVLRVVEHEAETFKPFDRVREQVVAAAAADQASSKAAAKGREVLEQLRQGQALADVSAANGWQLQSAEIGRESRQVPAEVVQAAFAVARPAADGKAHTGVVSAEGDYLLIEVDKVSDGDLAKLEETARSSREQQLQSRVGNAEFEGLTQALHDKASIELSSN